MSRDELMPSSVQVDPLVCPRGHHAITLSANRFKCDTCWHQDRDTTSWDRSELVDLREEEPPLRDDSDATAEGSA